MNTLEELKYYCEENQPVGAMLLTGEWGKGRENGIRKILMQK